MLNERERYDQKISRFPSRKDKKPPPIKESTSISGSRSSDVTGPGKHIYLCDNAEASTHFPLPYGEWHQLRQMWQDFECGQRMPRVFQARHTMSKCAAKESRALVRKSSCSQT